MTPVSTETATAVLGEITKVGTYIITSLSNFAGVFLAIAGIGIVLGMIYRAITLNRG